MKLRNLHIENYKMFKDFDIDFLDENDKPLDIVVLAGVNGSGKTSLLEYLIDNPNDIETTEIKENILDDGLFRHIAIRHNENQMKSNFVYFFSGIDDTKKVADEFVKTFYFFLKEKDYRPSEVKEHFDNYMQEIFNGLDLTFKYSHLDRDDNVWFSNENGEQFEIKDLSTGEKTLLSKVMYLYFLDYKDKVILIDEPELSLHPSWQNKVLKIYENFAKQNNCQIIIATHSPHIIGSAKPEYLRVLKKVNKKIEVVKYTQSYGLEFNKILTDIMGAETRVSSVSKRLLAIKKLIINNEFESEGFKTLWQELEDLIGADNIDLRLLKLEIASRKKNVSNK
ncbi:MAG: Putative ATP-binding protein [uncultured Sulfurovum sp.]|uniref:ATP-binding protein n=1 Tax=uncultured Sulfurovum sp. TaxID=269237 RepID=A0A6S6SXJ8_9BACT|nr:MAG: Putative ATP-binding protein [uncultured Sulfurovum sp.]